MTVDDFDDQVASIAALGEPVRRALYRYVVAQPQPVSRENAAAGVGVAPHVAKFHLDKLAEDGLLEAEYARPPGRGGPGAGRPAKVYRRAARPFAVSLPERHYELAGQILAEAVVAAQQTGTPIDHCLATVARATGRALAEGVHPVAEGAPDPPDPRALIGDALARIGYEPQLTADGVALRNCPFRSLAARHTALVCGMNLDLVGGMLGALPSAGLRARLDPAPGRCCVTIGPASDPES